MRKFVLLIAGLLTAFALPLSAQETDISPELAAELDTIEAYVIGVRGLDPVEPVIRVFPSREQVSDFLLTAITKQLTDDVVAEVEAFYVAFGFTSPDVDIVTTYLDLLEDQIGGYYDPEDKTMNTILISGGELSDALPSLEKTIYAHEFVHALQDQVYGLKELGFDADTIDQFTTDEALALQALVEGDATVVMSLYTNALVEQNPLAAFGLLSSSLASGSLTLPEDIPAILVRELLFPYSEGANFVTALINDGGWEAVDAAFENTPASTEHILHPETYLNGDMPVEVALSDTIGALDEGWTAYDDDVLGEFYLRAYLDTQLTAAEYAPAATGWGGDTYRVFEAADGETAFVLRLAWDTPADADEFLAAFGLFAEAATGATRDGDCWTAGRTLCLSQLPSGETVVTNAPDRETAAALLASQS